MRFKSMKNYTMLKSTLVLFTLLISILMMSCSESQEEVSIESPAKNNKIAFFLSEDGRPTYKVYHKEELLIDTSFMGFDFKKQPSFDRGFAIKQFEKSTFSETWEMPWGEQSEVLNHYGQLKVVLQENKGLKRQLLLYFRAYDDGVAFRYEFPKQEEVDSLIIMDENTEFQLTGDHTCWWIPGDWDIYEHLYNTTKVSEINAIQFRNNPNLAQSYIPENAVNTPVTMRTAEGLHLSFHEANLTDYSGMTLKVDTTNLKMTSELVGSDRLGYKLKRALPFKSPWRSIQIAERAGDLIESKLVLNLNEANKLGDVDWFQPMKYVGIWWEMHVGVASWDYGVRKELADGSFELTPHGRHGATTENAKRYIDFAAENGIGGVLVEGWNTGWEHWIGFEDREGVFDFVTPYPDYDLEEVVAYAESKGVELIMHHETSAAPRTYDEQLDTAYQLMRDLGIHSVKTGYVGKIIPKGEYHHGQWMVNHYRRVVEQGAKYKVAINAHEPIKATGIRRTYPNVISREGLRGQEFNAWAADGGNPPEHIPIVAFTRMLAGPIDFTPGVFEIDIPTKPDNQVNTTLAQQLALYVVLYSPVQMACDLPQNYIDQPAFQFIRDVGVDWSETKVLNGEIGDFITMARKEKGSENWFVGGVSDEDSREIQVDFDFLPVGKSYQATLYKDGKQAHFRDNPLDIEIEELLIDKDSVLNIRLAAGGGFALSLMAVD
jgi:hypothetical protein